MLKKKKNAIVYHCFSTFSFPLTERSLRILYNLIICIEV